MQINLEPEAEEKPGARVRVPVPGLHNGLGLGDAVAKVTDRLGVKPCGKCGERREKLNQLVRFNPWET
jgi:hypothetical protein